LPTSQLARQNAQRGFNLIELMAALAFVGIALAIATPRPDATAFALRNAANTLVADLRQTRAEAMTRGVHFRLEIVDVVTHRILRMRELPDGTWTQDGDAVVVRTAPSSTRMETTAVGLGFEFDTRGVLVAPTQPVSIRLTQSSTGLERVLDVWPSGQVTRGAA
jgi:prepilin-type N-terminal cleavage/methylation domain-containing protein